MEPFIGQIMMFAGNFPPRGWADCDGQLMPIAQHTALFSILGTTYGGDGRTTFALPDMRGRVPIHEGTGPGLSPYSMGQKSGQENVTLTPQEMPTHSHRVNCTNSLATLARPENNLPAPPDPTTNIYGTTAETTMAPNMVQASGDGQAHENRQPFLTIRFCIALQGIYPSRN